MKKLLVVILIVILLSGCGASEPEVPEVPPTIEDFSGLNIYIDPETGVNYLVNTRYKCGGISVRYNADGTVYVSDVKNQ